MTAVDSSVDAVEVSDGEVKNIHYGAPLASAREARGYSVEEVSEQLNISVDIIRLLEASDTESLPPPTFTQGYLRAFARLVDVSEERVLQDYAAAVPHSMESDLSVRNRLPKQATSNTPAVKGATNALIAIALLIIVYGFVSYYAERADEISAENGAHESDELDREETVNRLPIVIEQDASLSEDGELILGNDSAASQAAFLFALDEPASAVVSEQQIPATQSEPIMEATDNLAIYADEDSWVEITDARDESIFYNLLKQGEERELVGALPFDVFLGNAPVISISVNSTDVDQSAFVRSNKVARFRIIDDDGEPVATSR